MCFNHYCWSFRNCDLREFLYIDWILSIITWTLRLPDTYASIAINFLLAAFLTFSIPLKNDLAPAMSYFNVYAIRINYLGLINPSCATEAINFPS
jgi:hypothetical protein